MILLVEIHCESRRRRQRYLVKTPQWTAKAQSSANVLSVIILAVAVSGLSGADSASFDVRGDSPMDARCLSRHIDPDTCMVSIGAPRMLSGSKISPSNII